MKCRMAFYALISIVLLYLSACSTIPASPALPNSLKPAEGKAYLYGRFRKTTLLGFTTVSLAFVVENLDRTKSYRLGFVNSDDIQVIELDPDVYELTRLITNNGGDKISDVTFFFKDKFEIQENNAYYIGDFVYSYENRGGCCPYWYRNKFDDNFENTTNSFKNKYPHLAELPSLRIESDLLEQ